MPGRFAQVAYLPTIALPAHGAADQAKHGAHFFYFLTRAMNALGGTASLQAFECNLDPFATQTPNGASDGFLSLKTENHGSGAVNFNMVIHPRQNK
jgi:hypothetical protein